MKIAVVGSRNYPDLQLVDNYVRTEIVAKGHTVVTGGARGVDKAAEHAAGNACEVFKANWRLHGRAAGPIRNKLIVDTADKVVAFYDGKSRGTWHSMSLAKDAGKLLIVFGPYGETYEYSDGCCVVGDQS